MNGYFCAAIIFFILGFASLFAGGHYEETKPLTLPDGYSIMHSKANGKYKLITPNGGWFTHPYNTKRSAIEAAIRDAKKKPEDDVSNYVWEIDKRGEP